MFTVALTVINGKILLVKSQLHFHYAHANRRSLLLLSYQAGNKLIFLLLFALPWKTFFHFIHTFQTKLFEKMISADYT